MKNIPTYYKSDIEYSFPRTRLCAPIFRFFIDPTVNRLLIVNDDDFLKKFEKEFKRITICNTYHPIINPIECVYDIFIEAQYPNMPYESVPEVLFFTKEGMVFLAGRICSQDVWKWKQALAKKNPHLPKKNCIPNYIDNNGSNFYYETDKEGMALLDWDGLAFEEDEKCFNKEEKYFDEKSRFFTRMSRSYDAKDVENLKTYVEIKLRERLHKNKLSEAEFELALAFEIQNIEKRLPCEPNGKFN